MVKPLQSLDSLLNGEPEPRPEIEIAQRRDRNLYAPTPFIPKPPKIVACLTEQTCSSCGSTHTFFAGVYKDVHGRGLTGDMILRSRINECPRESIEEVKTTHETIPFCPSCLGA